MAHIVFSSEIHPRWVAHTGIRRSPTQCGWKNVMFSLADIIGYGDYGRLEPCAREVERATGGLEQLISLDCLCFGRPILWGRSRRPVEVVGSNPAMATIPLDN
jgi:hypothetical protein